MAVSTSRARDGLLGHSQWVFTQVHTGEFASRSTAERHWNVPTFRMRGQPPSGIGTCPHTACRPNICVIFQRACAGPLTKVAACSYFIEHKPAPTLLYIDGFEYGTLMRFANHCCQPNCAIEQWTRDGLPVTKVVAKKNMQAGKKELTIDYGSDFFTGDVTCQCGAPNCRKVAVPSTGRTQMQVSAGDRESDPEEFRFQAEGAVGLI
mgnify:CR=1 FL=1